MSERRIEGLAEIGRARFYYDPETGSLHYKDPGPEGYATLKGYRIFMAKCLGRVAGSQHADGYLRVNVGGRSFLAHRLIWAIMTGRDPGVTLDHRDGDRSNNRWTNLREATRSQNAMNRGPRSDCSSGVRGVHWHKASNMWAASISAGGVSQHLGLFRSKDEARAAFIAASDALHGEFAAHRGALREHHGAPA